MNWFRFSDFLRGALGALSLLGAAGTILPYTALDLVSGVHAVIVGWSYLAAGVGNFISAALALPPIPPDIVTAFIIGCTLGPPASFVLYRNERPLLEHGVPLYGLWALAISGFTSVLLGALILVDGTRDFVFLLAVICMSYALWMVLRFLPTYRSGFFTLMAFVATMEGVYLVSTDSFQASFDTFVCRHQSASAPRCQP